LCTAEIDDWNIVVIECKSLATKWEQLSIFLGLSCDVIDNIKGSGDNYHCWSEALKHWIRQNYNTATFGRPSWRTLLKAMAEIDKLLFERLAAKHSKPGMIDGIRYGYCKCYYLHVFVASNNGGSHSQAKVGPCVQGTRHYLL
jgi:hypothetical protein